MKLHVKLIIIAIIIVLGAVLAQVNKNTSAPVDNCGDPSCTTHQH